MWGHELYPWYKKKKKRQGLQYKFSIHSEHHCKEDMYNSEAQENANFRVEFQASCFKSKDSLFPVYFNVTTCLTTQNNFWYQPYCFVYRQITLLCPKNYYPYYLKYMFVYKNSVLSILTFLTAFNSYIYYPKYGLKYYQALWLW